MQADEEHIVTAIKNALGAIAMVVVHIQQSHAPGALVA